jgi:hypothetical protein
MIGSPEINQVIRRLLSPTLRENGFSKVKTRNNWGYHDRCIWVLQIRAVGKRTAFPSMSLGVGLGIYYDFLPEEIPIKRDKDGNLIPEEYLCHIRNELFLANIDQSRFTKDLHNSAEAARKDVWWVEPDSSNIEEVINDIKLSFLKNGLKWFNDFTNLEYAFKCIDHLSPDHMVEQVDEAGVTILTPRGHIYGTHAAREFARYLNYQDRVEAYLAWEEQQKLKKLERVYQFVGVLNTFDLARCLECSPDTIEGYGNSFENSRFVFTRTGYPGWGSRRETYWRISKSDST